MSSECSSITITSHDCQGDSIHHTLGCFIQSLFTPGAIVTNFLDLRLDSRLGFDPDRVSLETPGPCQVAFTKENHRDSVKSRRKSWRKSHIPPLLGLCDVLSFKVNDKNCDVIPNTQLQHRCSWVRQGVNSRCWQQQWHTVFTVQYIQAHTVGCKYICLRRLFNT